MRLTDWRLKSVKAGYCSVDLHTDVSARVQRLPAEIEGGGKSIQGRVGYSITSQIYLITFTWPADLSGYGFPRILDYKRIHNTRGKLTIKRWRDKRMPLCIDNKLVLLMSWEKSVEAVSPTKWNQWRAISSVFAMIRQRAATRWIRPCANLLLRMSHWTAVRRKQIAHGHCIKSSGT